MIGRGRNLSEKREEIVLDVRSARPVRLDRYLLEALAWRSRTRIQRLIRTGRVKVNGRPVKPSLAVKLGDRVTVHLSLGTGIPQDYDSLDIEILYEDPWLLAVNKPPGLLVHPVGRHVYDTLMNYLHHRYRKQMDPSRENHLRLCHRIDRDTTGVLVVAKEWYVHRAVQQQFESRLVHKRYLALVTGLVPEGLEEINRPLAEGRHLAGALQGPNLKPSLTRIWIREVFPVGTGGYTWLEASPETGRQNQIRVHLASVGHALVGDQRYGGPPSPEGFPGRFILHARRIRFFHPRLKSSVELEAPLPPDVEKLLGELRRGK